MNRSSVLLVKVKGNVFPEEKKHLIVYCVKFSGTVLPKISHQGHMPQEVSRLFNVFTFRLIMVNI